ncbi:MAG TPA: DUF4249 domain-containing protein, partial [Puia sp.]
MIRICFFLFVFSFFFASCEKNITIKLDPASTDLVVDASIENGKYPMVRLSRSLEYFGKLSPEALTASFVHDAIVTMNNGNITAPLKEDSSRDDSTGLVVYYYTFEPTYSGPKFRGAFSTSYNLEIQVGNKTYTATTT